MTVPLGIRETFAIFEDSRNLERITPPWLNFRIDTPGVVIREGAVIDYTIGWMGIPMRWRTVIEEYRPPEHFIDIQARGPYKAWRHRHLFREVEGGTLVADHVDYELPLGPLGLLAHSLLVRRQLVSIFRYRQTELARIASELAR
jgi:ligand-binding SRPBCC domain-containing protein